MKSRVLGLAAASLLTTTVSADITGVRLAVYEVVTEDFGGTAVSAFVHDLYMTSNDANDVLLNVFNLDLAATAQVTYFQSATGTGWLPNNLGSIFDTPALRVADSFVTIGGFDQDVLAPEQAPGAGSGTGLDPNFGGNNAAFPGDLAGWFNSSPPNLNGQVGMVNRGDNAGLELGVLVGRFSYSEMVSFAGTSLEVTWNQGLGTPGEQGTFLIIPGPASLALFGLVGVARGRRRGR